MEIVDNMEKLITKLISKENNSGKIKVSLKVDILLKKGVIKINKQF